MDKKILAQVRNATNTDWDNLYFETDIDFQALDIRIPQNGDTTIMDFNIGTYTNAGTVSQVNVITETFKDINMNTFKTVKAKILYDSNNFPIEMVEMFSLQAGPLYEIYTVFSINAIGVTISNDTIQAYGTWDLMHPVVLF